MPQHPLPFRAVQLDLARQMETVAFVERFAADAARLGFNTLFLYVEGRVRTASFALPEAESYSLDQITQMVAAAKRVGLDCLPATATLAHTEHFFQSGALKALAEERDGRTRFGTTRLETFCPSLPGTYEFMETYLRELTAVFPSPHLHVGCDEAFNLGFCPLCEIRRNDPQDGLQGLFIDHLVRIHAICQRLGKRMWIWDDMFELFPAAVERLPRDIVLCYWNYDPAIDVEGGRAHFANRERRDWLALYERLGFDTVFCPASYETRNIETITRYGQRHKSFGGLLTQWEMQQTQHEEYAVAVAFAGRLWSAPASADPAQFLQDAVAGLLPGAPEGLRTAVRTLASGSRKNSPPRSTWYTGPLTPAEETQRQATATALDLLRLARQTWQKPTPPGTALLDELDFVARLRLLYWNLQALLAGIHDLRRSAEESAALAAQAKAWRAELAALIVNREPIHARLRPGMFPVAEALENLRRLQSDIEPALARLDQPIQPTDAVVALRLALIDFHGAPRCAVALEMNGAWQTVFTGGLKTPDVYGTPFFTARIPCSLPVLPTAIRVEGGGYGGIGLAFVEIQTAQARLFPHSVRNHEGLVEHPEAALRDDSRFTQLGERDYRAAMLDPARAARTGTVILALQAVPN